MYGYGNSYFLTNMRKMFNNIIVQILTTAKLMKTGQTVSYRTGDDGDIEAGRGVSFTVLAEENPFGNTNRFTDELGGQTYTNNIVIDWSTYDGSSVLGYRRTLTTADTLDNVIAACSALNIAGFTGWRLTNYKELFNTYIPVGNVLTNNYSPFNVGSKIFWTNTTTGSGSAWISYNYIALPLDNAAVGAINNGMPCRDFTVIGTTLS